MENTKWKIDLPGFTCKESNCNAGPQESFIVFDALAGTADLVWLCENGHYNKLPCNVHEDIEKAKPHRSIRTKVSGVSFDNPDGTNRQSLLQYVKSGDPIQVAQGVINERKAFIVRHAIGILGVVKNEVIYNALGVFTATDCFDGRVIGVTGGEDGKAMLGCNIEVFVTAQGSPVRENTDGKNNQLGHSIYVYVDGEKKNIFHTDPHCSGLKNASKQKYEYAKNVLKARPCKKCGDKVLQKGKNCP